MPKLLGKVLADLESIAPALDACRLLSLWSEVVDDRVGKNTDPLKIRNRVLFISTTTPAWAQELSFLKEEIITKFNQKAGRQAISDIRFRPTGVC